MSPIIDIQRRLVEVGRIRMGASEERQKRDGGTYRVPKRLGTWRLTSRDLPRLEAAAAVYGGAVQPWDQREGEYVLDTEVDALPVAVLPGQNLSMWYELWGKPSQRKPIQCLRRCDGQTETISDSPCKCDPDARECKPTTRLSVLLLDVPGIGCWRFDSHGWYAAIELSGTAELLEAVTAQGQPYPARLRIDQRRQVKDGDWTVFPVPVLDIDVAPRQAMAAVMAPQEVQALAPPAEPQRALEQGHTPLPPAAPVTVGDALEATARQAAPAARTARSAEPIGPPIAEPEAPQAVPVPAEEAPEAAPEPPAPARAEPEPAPLPAPEPEPEQEPEQEPEPEPAAEASRKPTGPMVKKLNVLVGKLREAGVISTENLYAAVARQRNLDAGVMIELIDGARSADEQLHWGPLRDTLSFAEARDLIDRLDRLEVNANG